MIFAWVAAVMAAASPAWAGSGGQAAGLSLIEAVEITLSRQPGIQLDAETVRRSKGLLQEEQGLFDPTIALSGGHERSDRPLPAGAAASRQTVETTSQELSLQNKLRNGWVLRPGVSLRRTEDPLSYRDVQNYATVNFKLTVPLLRGAGEAATTGRETAARKAYEASLLQHRHVVSSRVLDTATAYWNYVAQAMALRELGESESRAAEYLRIIGLLVQGDERPGSDLHQVMANQEDKAAQRIAGEQAFREARQTLGLAMGLSAAEIERLPPPADPFPPIPESQAGSDPLASLLEQALKRRDDYLAAQEDIEAARALREVARNGLRPILDMDLQAGYSGLAEGSNAYRYFGSLGTSVPGPSASVSLTYQWPVGNNAARGRFLQTDAEYQRRRLSKDDLARTIESAVALAFSSVGSAAAEAARTRRSLSLHERSLEDEFKKARLGASTFLDVFITDDRLLSAKRGEISARLRYALGVARLRFAAGLILSGQGDRVAVRAEDLTALPPEAAERKTP